MKHGAKHPPILTVEEALALYEASAFLLWMHGVTFTVHVTISWSALGVSDGETAMKILSLFNSEVGKYLRVGFGREGMQRHSSRYGYGSDHFYVGVHESGGERGLHTHMLLTVRRPIAPVFIAWTKRRIRDLSGRSWAPDNAVYVSVSNARNEAEAVERHWAWVRYLMKQVERHKEIVANDGSWVPIDAILKPWPQQTLQELPMAKAVLISRNLGRNARRVEGFRSRYLDGDFDDLFRGYELQDRRERIRRWEADEELASVIATLDL